MLTKTLSEAKKKQRISLIKAMNNDIGSIDLSKDSWNPAQISERAKDISYIRSLVDTWNPAQLNEALQMLDLPVIDTWNPAQIEEQRRNIAFYLVERTLTGNPITLNIIGNLTPEVTGLKVTMNPIQDLSHGDPSPTNICPISGRDSVTVTRTAGEDVETNTHSYSSTVYGGVDDFVNGGATSTMGIVDLGTLTWSYNNIQKFFYADITDMSLTTKKLICDSYVYVEKSWTSFVNGEFGKVTNSTQVRFHNDNYTTPSDFKTAMSGVQLCYELATPTPITNTPEDITLLKGVNVLSTDGDSIELKYKQNF